MASGTDESAGTIPSSPSWLTVVPLDIYAYLLPMCTTGSGAIDPTAYFTGPAFALLRRSAYWLTPVAEAQLYFRCLYASNDKYAGWYLSYDGTVDWLAACRAVRRTDQDFLPLDLLNPRGYRTMRFMWGLSNKLDRVFAAEAEALAGALHQVANLALPPARLESIFTQLTIYDSESPFFPWAHSSILDGLVAVLTPLTVEEWFSLVFRHQVRNNYRTLRYLEVRLGAVPITLFPVLERAACAALDDDVVAVRDELSRLDLSCPVLVSEAQYLFPGPGVDATALTPLPALSPVGRDLRTKYAAFTAPYANLSAGFVARDAITSLETFTVPLPTLTWKQAGAAVLGLRPRTTAWLQRCGFVEVTPWAELWSYQLPHTIEPYLPPDLITVVHDQAHAAARSRQPDNLSGPVAYVNYIFNAVPVCIFIILYHRRQQLQLEPTAVRIWLGTDRVRERPLVQFRLTIFTSLFALARVTEAGFQMWLASFFAPFHDGAESDPFPGLPLHDRGAQLHMLLFYYGYSEQITARVPLTYLDNGHVNPGLTCHRLSGEEDTSPSGGITTLTLDFQAVAHHRLFYASRANPVLFSPVHTHIPWYDGDAGGTYYAVPGEQAASFCLRTSSSLYYQMWDCDLPAQWLQTMIARSSSFSGWRRRSL